MSSKPLALSVKLIVLGESGCVLLLRRSMASKNNPGKWDLPGGKADPCETLDKSARREVFEETGLDIIIGRILGAAESESPDKRIAYLILEARAESNEVELSDEHDAYTWVSPVDLPNYDLLPQFRPVVDACAKR